MLLDAAHDAEAIYHLMDHQNIEPFIDLNSRPAAQKTPVLPLALKPSTVGPTTPTQKTTCGCLLRLLATLKSGR